MQVEIARFSFQHSSIVAPAFGKDPEDQKYLRDVWRTLHYQYVLACFELGEYTEWDLRNEFADGIFRSEEGREWWGPPGERSRRANDRSPRSSAIAILDDEVRRIESRAASSGNQVPGSGASATPDA
jgi:hypothetical protein